MKNSEKQKQFLGVSSGKKPSRSVRTDFFCGQPLPYLCGRKKDRLDWELPSCKLIFGRTYLIWGLTILSSFRSSVVDLTLTVLSCNRQLQHGFQPGLGLDCTTACTDFNAHIFSPCFVLLPAGLQLVVRDTETAPENLFFELRKPPQHGTLMKYTAGFPGPMAAGSPSPCYWPACRISCCTVSSMCFRFF